MFDKIDLTNKFMLLPSDIYEYYSGTEILDDTGCVLINLSSLEAKEVYGYEALEYIKRYGDDCLINCYLDDNGIITVGDTSMEITDIGLKPFRLTNDKENVTVLIDEVSTSNFELQSDVVAIDFKGNKFVIYFSISRDLKYVNMFVNGKKFLVFGVDNYDIRLDTIVFSHFYVYDNKLFIYIYAVEGTAPMEPLRICFSVSDIFRIAEKDEYLGLHRNTDVRVTQNIRLNDFMKYVSGDKVEAYKGELSLEAYLVKVKLSTGLGGYKNV